jgi:hypothetical protein
MEGKYPERPEDIGVGGVKGENRELSYAEFIYELEG